MSRIGIFSGTFDPIHTGHIEFALSAIASCQLDAVYFLPEKTPREKERVSLYSDRVAMLELALNNYPKFKIIRGLDSKFTVAKTLPKLKQKFANDKLVFLLGSDVVKTFAYRWDGLGEFLQSVELCIGLRLADAESAVEQILEATLQEYGIHTAYTIITSTGMHIASTVIRHNAHSGSDVDDSVAKYIADNKLYS